MSPRRVPAVVVGVLLAALTLSVPLAAAAPSPSERQKRLAKSQTFIPALGVELTQTNVKRLAYRDLVVVDGDDATAGQVRRLQSRGAVVLAYLSVGSVESWRSWFSLLEPHRLEPLGDWDGERYTDLSAPAARDALADVIAPKLLAKGFDGLFLDWVDMIEDHPAQRDGMLDVVKRLSTLAHGQGRVLMAQNGDAVIEPFLGWLDGWNREDATGTYDFDAKKYVQTDAAGRELARLAIARQRKAGLLVTTTDYFGSPRSPAARRAVRIACKAGAVPFVGDIELKKVPADIPDCD